MNANHDRPSDQVSACLDRQRRGFLGRLLAAGAAIAAIPSMAAVGLADEEGFGAGRGQGPRGKGGAHGGPQDPIALAARLIQEFDKDGDKALNQAELVSALAALQERGRGRGAPGDGGQGRGKGLPGPGGAGHGKGKGGKG